jgi:peptidoglycan/xylan/chitin deacetylase (PgdA/CDA1 family)
VRSAILANLAGRRTAAALRILTYHAVPDRAAFEAQAAWLARHYSPIGQDAVLAAFDGAPLPPRAAWVTFDDGDPSVVRTGLPVLRSNGIPATMFVCPGLIESGEPSWWTVVERTDLETLAARIPAPVASMDDALDYLKSVEDRVRREFVSELPRATERDEQLSAIELQRWLDAGFAIGNHTWDHPCLNRCTEDGQRDQVARADAWLRALDPEWLPVFAYPNGNSTPTVEDELAARGYRLGLLHDHRIAKSFADRYRVSRLDTRADDDVARLRGVVSGLHSTLSVATSALGRTVRSG